MGFHCGNTASTKLSFCEMKYQLIMARALPIEVTNGTLEGDIVPGPITFYRLQSTADNILRAYIAQGEVLPVATRSFGGIGIFAIPKGGRAKNCFRNFFNALLWNTGRQRPYTGPLLPPRTYRKELPTPRCRCIRPLWQGTLRSIQVHWRTGRRDWLQPA